MVAVPSTMQALGSPAQFFSLPDVRAANNEVSLQDFVGQPLLVMFICNHCPFVIHIVEQMVALANNAQAQGFRVVAVSSNDTVAYPQDGPELMAEFARECNTVDVGRFQACVHLRRLAGPHINTDGKAP